ncbi:MAG: hypothetical protein JETT_2346 [Candidatus Jettenia ecosi]|uniref:Uncharacterized protein n=1 Tax=Candidatus Jettenia ecosi TaxID=2494326 RepID=A0A533QAM3_9BACT|nr:MAG: hypothetical protein JETT_2346 [Candidatus Jettenia ecosi]
MDCKVRDIRSNYHFLKVDTKFIPAKTLIYNRFALNHHRSFACSIIFN